MMAVSSSERAGPRREQGMTAIGGLLVLVVAGIFVLAAARLIPAYIEAGEIGSTLHSVRDAARTKSIGEVRSELASQLEVNNLDSDVSLDEFKFTGSGGELTITIDHRIRTPFIGNLGFTIHVHRSMTVKRAQSF